jgi:hypothetical protein
MTAKEKRDRKVAERGERRCPVCEAAISDTVTLKAVCCSRACGVTHQNRLRAQRKREEFEAANPLCERCGLPIPAGVGRTKFCSWKCKHAEMGARQRKRYPHYMRQYVHGVSPEQYAGMLDQQGHACAICGDTEWWAHMHAGSPQVDHDHATGEVRGLLCGRCNTGLGQFQDDPERLHAAARYLERYRS